MRFTLSAEEQKALFILMGISGNGVDLCDEESLKKAFRNKAKRSHPDLAAHMGMDPRLMKLKFQELNDAFNILMERVRREQVPSASASSTPASRGKSFYAKSGGAGKSGRAAKSGGAAKSGRAAKSGGAAKSGTASKSERAAKSASGSKARSTAGDGVNTAKSSTAFKRRSGEAPKNTQSTAATSPDTEKIRKSTAYGNKASDELFFGGKTPERNLRFAEYLYYSGYISWTDLVQALVWQYRNRPKIGELATESGLLDFAEVLEIIRAKNPFELFGEAAVRLGYLSPAKLDNLINEQKRMGHPIGNYFTSTRIMTKDTLHKKLSENRRHNYQYSDKDKDKE